MAEFMSAHIPSGLHSLRLPLLPAGCVLFKMFTDLWTIVAVNIHALAFDVML